MPAITLAYALPDGSDLRISPYAANVQRSWVLNEVGSATLEIPSDTPDLARIAMFGALIWLYEDGVPPFVGYVEEVTFADFGSVVLGLRSAEGLLKGQITRQAVLLGESTVISAGAVAYGVFESAVLRNSRSPLRAGVFDAENATFLKATYADCLEVFKKLVEDDRAAFWVDENLAVHFRGRRGSDKRESVYLYHGYNFLGASVRGTAADTINAAVVVGDSSNPTDGRTAALRFEPAGQFRAEVLTFSSAKDQAQSRQYGIDTLRVRRWPTYTIEGFLPRQAAEWGNCWLGDIVRVISPLVPWQKEFICRVVGTEIGQDDQMRLVLDVLPPADRETPATWALT